MRRLAFVALVLAACGGSEKVPDDFSVTGDIALPLVSQCIGIVACASGCETSECVDSCEGPADAAAISLYEALATCAKDACGSDAGTSDSCFDDAMHGKNPACTTEYTACLQ